MNAIQAAILEPGTVVRRKGQTQLGKVLSVEDDYATVDFAIQRGSIRIGLLPLSALEFALMDRTRPKRPTRRPAVSLSQNSGEPFNE
jgi:hypothetical protein